MPEWRSVLTRFLNFSTFLPIFIVTGRPGRSSSIASLPSDTILCHSDTWALDTVFSPYASRNKLNISMEVLWTSQEIWC
jgi:hypothetical protein